MLDGMGNKVSTVEGTPIGTSIVSDQGQGQQHAQPVYDTSQGGHYGMFLPGNYSKYFFYGIALFL